MYIRFVPSDRTPASPGRFGIFHVVLDVSRDPFLPQAKQQHLQTLFPIRWMRLNGSPAHAQKTPSLCWFQPDAREFTERVFALKHFLNSHGHPIDLLRTQQIGYDVWEDDVQAVAKPFLDTLV